MSTPCLVHIAGPHTGSDQGATSVAPQRMLLAKAFHTCQEYEVPPRITLEGVPVPLVALVQRLPEVQMGTGRVFAVVADVTLLRYASNVGIRFKYFRLANCPRGAVVRFDCEADFEHFWALQKDFVQWSATEGNDPPRAQMNDPLIHPPIIAIDSAQTRVKDDAVACWKEGNEIVLRSYAAWVIRDANIARAWASINKDNSSDPLTLLEVLPSPLKAELRSAFDVQMTSHDGTAKKRVFENERELALNGDAPERRALVFETRFDAKTLDELVQHRKFFVTKDRISFHLSQSMADEFTRWFSHLSPVCPALPDDVRESLQLLARLGQRHSPVIQTRDTMADPRYAVESCMTLSKEDGVTHKLSVFGKAGEKFGEKPQGLLSGKKFFLEFLCEVLCGTTGVCPLEVAFPEENASLFQHQSFLDNLFPAGKDFLRDAISPKLAAGQTAFHHDVATALVHSLIRGEQSYASDLMKMIGPNPPGGFSVVVSSRVALAAIKRYKAVDAERQAALLAVKAKGPITDLQKARIYLANPTPTFSLVKGVRFDLDRQLSAKEAQLGTLAADSPHRARCQADIDALKWLLDSAGKPVKSPKCKWDGSKACRHYFSALSQLLLAVLLQRNGGMVTPELIREDRVDSLTTGFFDEEKRAIKAHLGECLLREAERNLEKEEEESHTLRALLNSDQVPSGYQLLTVAYVKEYDANTNVMKVLAGKLDCLVEMHVPGWNTPVGFGSQVQLMAEFKDLQAATARPQSGVSPTLLSGGRFEWFPHPNGNRNEFVLQEPNRCERECRVSLYDQPQMPPAHYTPLHVQAMLKNDLNRIPFPPKPNPSPMPNSALIPGRLVSMKRGGFFAFLRPFDKSPDVYVPSAVFRGRFRESFRNAIAICTAYSDETGQHRKAAWAEWKIFSGTITRCLANSPHAFISPDENVGEVYFEKAVFRGDPAVVLSDGLRVKFIVRDSAPKSCAVWVTALPPCPEQSAEPEEGDEVLQEEEGGTDAADEQEPDLSWEPEY